MNSESSATVLKPLPSEMDDEVKTTVLPQTAGVAINNRFFFVALAAGALVMIGVHFLHVYQMERISRVFFENAEQSAAAGESRDAVRFVQKYLNFHPNDLEARVLLASELAKTAETPRQMLNVALICEGILRRDAARRDLRLQIAKFYLRLGQHRDALLHLIVLLGETPDNGELLLQAAECHQALGEYDKAAATYRQLIRLNPQDARVYERLAYLLRDEMRQPEAADHLIQELMDSNRRNALAYGVRARYRHRYGELKHAARDAGIAYQLDPQNSDVVQVVATITIDQLKAGEKTDFPPTQVRSDLKRLLAKTPEDKAIVAALIDLDLADGRSERAEERLRSLLKDNPTNVAARFQLADLLLVANRVNESKSEIGRIRNLGVRSQAVDFLEARILIVQKRWLDAIHILENVHFSSAETPELASSVYQQLGQCYEQIGHHHRRLRAYRDAVTANPRSADAHLGLASALARLGRIDDALAEYQQLREHPAVALATAQLQLLKQLLLPKAERNWTGVESAIAEAIRKNADADQTLRLRVLVMMAQEQEDAARRFLEQERNKRPKSLAVWLLSAQIENWAGQPDRAAKVLENAQGVLGKSVELQLARLRLRSRRGEGTNADWVLGQMEAWDDLPENFRVPVLGELTEGLEETKSDPQEALRLRLEMAALKPNDLRIWRRVLSLGIAANDDEAATRAVGEIRRIEGESGSYWRLAEADRLLMHARQGKTAFDGAAEKLLEKLRNDLPTDWTIPLRLAEIAERQGRTDRAIDHYKAILNMEMYHPQVVKRLIALLFSKGRDAEADGYLTKLQRTRPNSFGAQYGRVATVVALRSQHRIRALELARQAVKTDSKDPKDQLWLGQILGVLEMPQQAETALRKSIELEPQQTAARIALVRLLQTSNRVQEAREEIQALKDAVPAEKAAFPLAYCLELTDQPQAAYQAYQDLVKNNAREGYFRWVLADYCLRSGRRPQAESLLRSLLDSPHKWKDAPQLAVRRSLAQVLVQKPGYRSNVEALALLEKNLATDSRSLPDLRMKAHLLARRPIRQQRQKALAVFDQLAELTRLTRSDEIQRVQLLKHLGRVSEANNAVKALLAHSENDPKVLRFGIKHLLESGDEKETLRHWFARLEKKVPDDFSTINLKARLLVAEGKSSEAISALEAWITPQTEIPDRKRETIRLEQIVLTLTSLAEQQDGLGLPRSADALAAAADRHLAELIRRKPERMTWKLRFLTARWRLDEAWKLVPEAWKSAPAVDVASGLVPLLQKSREDQRQYENLRGPLEAALQNEPDSLDLKILAATIAQLCEEYDAAIRLYRSAVERKSNSITARNELAVLLTLHGMEDQATEALGLIDGAIEQAGPAHFLLDTKAKVLIALHRPRLAISLLTQAIADTPSSSKYFHLMQSYLLLRQRKDAQRVYRTALADGFSPNKLHPLERPAANEVLADLKE